MAKLQSLVSLNPGMNWDLAWLCLLIYINQFNSCVNKDTFVNIVKYMYNEENSVVLVKPLVFLFSIFLKENISNAVRDC